MINSKDCLRALRRVANRIDSSPTQSEYETYRREKEPSYVTINSKFNGWNNAKQEAGLSVFQKSYTEEECLDAIQHVANELERSPTVREYRRVSKDSDPSITAIKNKFGKWSKAKNKLGLSELSRVLTSSYR